MSTPDPKTPRDLLAQDAEIKRWYSTLGRDRRTDPDTYLVSMFDFILWLKPYMKHSAFLQLSAVKTSNLLKKYKVNLVSSGKSPFEEIRAIQCWASYCNRDIDLTPVFSVDELEKPIDMIEWDYDVDEWYTNLKNRKMNTAKTYLPRLFWFFKWLLLEKNTTHKQFLKMSHQKRASLLMKYRDHRQKVDKVRGSTIATDIKPVKNWAEHMDRPIKKKINVSGAYRRSPKIEDERIPDKNELRCIFNSGTKRARIICGLIAESGVRLEVFGTELEEEGNPPYDWWDDEQKKWRAGLVLKDFVDLKIYEDRVEFTQKPCMLKIREQISKNGKPYITFVSEEVCDFIESWLNELIVKGRKLDEYSSLLPSTKSGKLGIRKFVASGNIYKAAHKAFKEASKTTGYMARPYVLRSYCETTIMLCESQGYIIPDYRKFFLGRSCGIQGRYSLEKRLPQEVLDDLRKAYTRCQPELETMIRESVVKEDVVKHVLSLFLPKEILDKVDLDNITDEEIQELTEYLPKKDEKPEGKNVSVEELDEYIEDGWVPKMQLESIGKVYVERPPKKD